ncbi:MAG: hypothetical protein OEW59_07970 [Gammaproteobacteria bacterium]|nr:hypothetical protein [Gammaproteobacteria bacterium]
MTSYLGTRTVAFAVIAAGFFTAGCAGNEERTSPPPDYAATAANTPDPKCPAGSVLQCESKRTGRIRFGMIGKKNLESCSCEHYQGMPTQSPLPGIY